LINIVKQIDNSIGYGIDLWENNINLLDDKEEYIYKESFQVEKSFYKNVEIENMKNRITGIKGDPKDILTDFLSKKEFNFDFIYIINSDNYNNLYINLYLSWKLLNKGGMLAVNNYRLEIMKDIIDSFLKDINKQYNIIDDTFRLFIEKI
jgi:predicted O-methyltransferase YrrM